MLQILTDKTERIKSMKAFVIKNPLDAGLYEVDKPVPKADEVLIKVKAAGFCGTDIHTYKGEHPTKYPVIPGHEFSGTIAECGAQVSRFNIGDAVVADPNVFCENCIACKSNHQIHCENIQVIGNTSDGAFAEYVVVPERCVFHAGSADLIQASMAEPLACCINSHNKYEIRMGSRALIMGAGTIGLMQVMLTKRRGAADITVIDLKMDQLEIAKKLGANCVFLSDGEVKAKLLERHPEGYDIVIDATGVPKVVEMGIQLLANNGTFVAFGACPPGSQITVNPFDVYYKDLRIIGSYALEKTLGQSLRMMGEGGMNLEPLIGQVISLDEMPRLFDDFVHGRTQGKVIVAFDD